jgi:uncharacterized peroxidase-related enzyme
MAYISLPSELPGIQGVLSIKPAVSAKIVALLEEVLRGPGRLSLPERELIAARTSARNACDFCDRTHASTACHLDPDVLAKDAVESVRRRALMSMADAVADGGRQVTVQHIRDAHAAGMEDEEIHDTVLIASVFCMVNRYIDGLGADSVDDPEVFDQVGAYAAAYGYLGLVPRS